MTLKLKTKADFYMAQLTNPANNSILDSVQKMNRLTFFDGPAVDSELAGNTSVGKKIET